MKGFFKFLGSLMAIFGSIIAALAIFDKFSNKNRIRGEYLECDISNNGEDFEENE